MTEVWVDPAAGLDSNPGTQAAPFQTMTAAVVASTAPAIVHLLPGAYEQSLNLVGPIPGQKTPYDLQILGSGTGDNFIDCEILPPAGEACLTLAWGASCCLGGVLLNGSNSNQDLIQVGQQSNLVISKPMCFGAAHSPANHMTIAFGGGLTCASSYNIWCAGATPQCHIDVDDGWTFFANTNPGYFTMKLLDSTAFTDSFVHCAGAAVNIQGVNWACMLGAVDCVTCIVEKCGYIDTGTSQDFATKPNPNYFPGVIAPITRGGGVYC